MKFSIIMLLAVLGVFLTNPSMATANEKCIEEAKKQAQDFVAFDAQVPVGLVFVSNAFFVEVDADIIYYGVSTEYDGFTVNVNVGLREKDCSLADGPYHVTDPYDTY